MTVCGGLQCGVQNGLTMQSRGTENSIQQEEELRIDRLRMMLDSDEGIMAACFLMQGGEVSSQREMLDSKYLRRWLRARDWDVEAAARCIINHAQWRAETMPSGRVLKSEIANELASGKGFLLQQCDRQGRALLLIQFRKHSAYNRKLPELERFCCYMLDAAIARCDMNTNPEGHIVVILDLTGMGTLNMDIQAVKALFKLLAEHYVERLGQMVIYNPPMLFWGAWNAVSLLLAPATLKKIMVVSPDERQHMIDAVGAHALPAEYGGVHQSALVPVS